MNLLGHAFIVLVLGLPACASVQTPAPPATPSTPTSAPFAPGLPTHTIQKGETLWHIAKIYQVDLEELGRLNNISDTTHISVGQNIVLPHQVRTRPVATNFASTAISNFVWPVKGKILEYFRQKDSGVENKGIDIATQTNQDIIASRNGKVAFIGNLAGYGNTIIIDHADGFSSIYCGPAAVSVKAEEIVVQGATIAKTGQFPRAHGTSLHFEIRKQHKPINPMFFLDTP